MSNSDTTTPQRTRRRGQRLTAEEKQETKEKFLKALSNTANVRVACMQAGVDHSTVYRWQEMDENFGFRFREANKDANWILFGEAWQRAMKGEEEYVVSGGKLIYGPDGKPLTQRKKSDRMLELLLKARLPEFRDKQQVEMSGSIDINGAKEHLLVKLSNMVRTVNATPEDE
jgi:hypothetical protein